MSERATDRPLAALVWMAASALSFSLMAIAVKRIGGSIPEFELVFFRSLINFVVVLAIMLTRGEKLVPERGMRHLLVFRGISGFCAISCLFFTINHLPLPVAMLLGWCSPLFVILFSRLFLKEKLPRRVGIGVIAAFGGLLLVLKPDFKHGFVALSLGAVGVGLAGAAFAGASYVAIRAATARVGANLVVLSFMAVSGAISAPLALANFQRPTGMQLFEVLALGLAATLGQLTMTRGYRYAPAGLVSTMSLLTAAFSAVFGWIIFDERLAILQWSGMVVLSLGIATLTWGGRARTDASRSKLRYEYTDALQD